MARPRIEFTPLEDTALLHLLRAGMPAADVAKVLHKSKRTLERRLRDLGGSEAVQATHADDELAAEDQQIPTVNDELVAARWLDRVERTARAADTKGNVAALATCGRLVASFLEHRRKAAPPDEVPNGVFVTNEVMNAHAAHGREKLHQLADALVRTSKSPVADSIRNILAEQRAAEAGAPACLHCGAPKVQP